LEGDTEIGKDKEEGEENFKKKMEEEEMRHTSIR
jgi:hypothetical protein